MDAEAVIIGGGVVGLAVAAALGRRGRRALVLERRSEVGQEASSRNSEVIHAGLYYPPGSQKAVTCVEGRERLYRRCRELGIPHRRTGKLVVATRPEEIGTLENLLFQGRENDAGELTIVGAEEVRKWEPRVLAHAALHSPESGIVDAHALMSSYQAEAESYGARIVLHTTVVDLDQGAAGWTVHTRSTDGESFSVETPFVVNAAGLEGDRIAALAGLDVDALGWRLRPCKGSYFGVAPSLGRLTEHLVYPVPRPGGLGIHVTMDLGSRYRLGPDVEYVDRVDYTVEPGGAARFAEAAARYLPEIQDEHLSPDFAGVRPKLQGPGEGFRDFVVEEASAHGAPGLVNLIGIESPGLTAAGAIAERVPTWLP
jgi:L-2-hydroxyglutarate oxidase LhgO